MTRRDVDAIGRTLCGAPVRVASTVVLLLVVGSVVPAHLQSTPIGLGSTSILSGLTLLGLREDRSWAELAQTRVGSALVSLLAPPSDEPQR